MDGLIFDVDGTLWDSTDVAARSWNETISKYTELTKRVDGTMLKQEFGKPMDDIMDSLYPSIVGEERVKIADLLFGLENDAVAVEPCILYSGMAETIKELSKRYKLFIVSNCQAGYIEAFFENTKLQSYFTDYTCPGDTGKLKADNIRIMMGRNNLSSAVYIGDTQGDANACKEAGVPMIFARYGFEEVENEAAYTCIDSFEQLLDMDFDAVK